MSSALTTHRSCQSLHHQMIHSEDDGHQRRRCRRQGGGVGQGVHTHMEDGPQESRLLWVIRLVLTASLVCVAVGLAWGAYWLIDDSEQEIGTREYEAFGDRALDLVQEVVLRRYLVIKAMAQIAGSAFPQSQDWPNVAIPAFETFARDLVHTSDLVEVALLPLVIPVDAEQTAFEEFAYDYFNQQRYPPFPNGTAVQSFGRGIWRQSISNTSLLSSSEALTTGQDKAVHDTSGDTSWDSPYKVLFPMLQSSAGDDPGGKRLLLYNMHADETVGKAIDEVLECVLDRKQTRQTAKECGTVTGIHPTSHESFYIYPIFPASDFLEFAGVIISRVSWDAIMSKISAGTGVSGITAVLSSEGAAYSYSIEDGVATFIGQGHLYDEQFADDGRFAALQGTDLSGASDRRYDLALYPTATFYESYQTNNPLIALIGTIAIVCLTSLFFFVYDFAMRREIRARQNMLQAKRRYMRFISHEVRTPLNAVCMGVTLLEEEMSKTLPDEQEQEQPTFTSDIVGSDESRANTCQTREWITLLQDIAVGTTNAVNVLNDLLNYDKVESQSLALELSVFCLWDLIKEISAEFELSARTKQINFAISNDDLASDERISGSDDKSVRLFIVGDRIRLSQVIRNLVSNGIKFTPEHGEVTIRIKWEPLQAPTKGTGKDLTSQLSVNGKDGLALMRHGSILMEVADTGAGMDQEQLRVLGQEGIQFNVGELQAGQGSGLGLFISKGIIRQHGGALRVHSAGLGCGTTFTCCLPAYRESVDEFKALPSMDGNVAATEAPSSAFGTASSSAIEIQSKMRHVGDQRDALPIGSLHVLVVDDVSTNRRLLKRLLMNHGHTVDEASDGREAVNMIAGAMQDGHQYDCVLMDYEMPVLRGPPAVKEIREKLLGDGLFICGVTGNVLTQDIDYFTECGANEVLAKPIKMASLEELWAKHNVRSGAIASGKKIQSDPTFHNERVLL